MSRRTSRWIASTALAALLGSSLAAHSTGTSQDATTRPGSQTFDVLALCKTTNVAATARKLVDLGAGAAAELTRSLVLEDARWTTAQLEAIDKALHERLADARAALLAVAHENATFAVHARALDLLARIGAARDFSTAVELARTSAAASSADLELDDTLTRAGLLRECSARLIERSPRVFDELTRALEECPDDLASALIDSLVDAGRSSELELLADLLGARAWNATYLLGALSRTARALPPPFSERVCGVVRDELGSHDSDRVREAASCAGWLEDERAAEELAELLAHTDAGVRANARWALRRITSRSFAVDPLVWRRWIDEQRAWWSESAADAFEQIARGKPAERAGALNDVLRHRWPRHELARELALALPADDARTIAIGCQALASLHSQAAVEPLRELLGHVDGSSREAVEEALRALETPLTSRTSKPAARAPLPAQAPPR